MEEGQIAKGTHSGRKPEEPDIKNRDETKRKKLRSWEKTRMRREKHILGESQREQEIKIEMKPQKDVSQRVVNASFQYIPENGTIQTSWIRQGLRIKR